MVIAPLVTSSLKYLEDHLFCFRGFARTMGTHLKGFSISHNQKGSNKKKTTEELTRCS